MFHQMKNVIGVDPSNYEFILMVDADTEVLPDSLNRMVSCMVHDAKIVGLCGETMLANEKGSLITMMQVYEYYISHHLAKAFESLFGSVTCLPGCFCMYRIHTPNKSIPLLTSIPVVTDYSVNNVDTLHKKNLLSLGEDRYLTTLMLKHFPKMKLKFTRDAQCRTFAPDRWGILLSQRRRWINSTIHNLLELLLLPELCGFCCLSMRFVALFDLFATLVMPATLGYLFYLVYNAVMKKFFPLISLILLAAGYGLQILIFLARGQWQHIGWLAIYILALPVFTFVLPAYSFWHMDDFSWGNTRIVIGERGGKKTIIDEEPFDPSSIPVKRWSEYEEGLWDEESVISGFSQSSRASGQRAATPPVYQASPAASSGAPSAGPQPFASPLVLPTEDRLVTAVDQPRSDEPTDEQIESQIRGILATADLMTVTKKQIRLDLAQFFGMDMSAKKQLINKVIEDVLNGG